MSKTKFSEWQKLSNGFEIIYEWQQLENGNKPESKHVKELAISAKDNISRRIQEGFTSGNLYNYCSEGKKLIEYTGVWSINASEYK